jgi:hypothetical protein
VLHVTKYSGVVDFSSRTLTLRLERKLYVRVISRRGQPYFVIRARSLLMKSASKAPWTSIMIIVTS